MFDGGGGNAIIDRNLEGGGLKFALALGVSNQILGPLQSINTRPSEPVPSPSRLSLSLHISSQLCNVAVSVRFPPSIYASFIAHWIVFITASGLQHQGYILQQSMKPSHSAHGHQQHRLAADLFYRHLSSLFVYS